MFGLFGNNKDRDKGKGKKGSKAASNPNATSSEAVREAALAQFRKTEQELGPETIAAMKRAVEMEKAKKKIRSAIDDEGKRDQVVNHLRDILHEDR